MVVNGMRVRIKLDEERIAELLRGMDASTIPGLLKHLGDVASLSFVPFHNGEPTGMSFKAHNANQSSKCCKHYFVTQHQISALGRLDLDRGLLLDAMYIIIPILAA